MKQQENMIDKKVEGKSKRYLLYIGIAGSIICLCGDLLLGLFVPAEKQGIFKIFPAFSKEWRDASPIRLAAGGLLGVIALLLMFCGLYAIYEMMKKRNSRYSRVFLIASCVFTAVGTLYHCVFAMTAWIYNQLATYNLDLAKQISEKMFLTFIGVAFLAAIAFVVLSVEMLLAGIENMKNKKWIWINPLLFMGLLVIASIFLPDHAITNGVFQWGQQSISLLIVFFVYAAAEKRCV